MRVLGKCALQFGLDRSPAVTQIEAGLAVGSFHPELLQPLTLRIRAGAQIDGVNIFVWTAQERGEIEHSLSVPDIGVGPRKSQFPHRPGSPEQVLVRLGSSFGERLYSGIVQEVDASILKQQGRSEIETGEVGLRSTTAMKD